ncbi:MAG: NADH-quinone oxidoreductase subunit C [Balneolaceae bacterium]
MKQQEEIFEYLQKEFGEETVEFYKGDVGQPWLKLPAEYLKKMANFLRDNAELRFNTLMCLSGTHYPDKSELGVTYHLHSTLHGHTVAFKVATPADQPEIPSVESIWKTANWHEREAMDMFGILFKDHPNMKRILCPDDWQGYPLRKDYKPQEYYQSMPTGT